MDAQTAIASIAGDGEYYAVHMPDGRAAHSSQLRLALFSAQTCSLLSSDYLHSFQLRLFSSNL